MEDKLLLEKRRELIKKIKKIEIYTTHLVNEKLAGQYLSVFKGHGIAFQEVREYIPGDDIRLIDWNVSARMNNLYVKLFVEERELTILLIVDMSGSLEFGTKYEIKKEVVAQIGAMLSFSAIKNNDRIGLIIFTDRVELFVPPKKGKKHVLRVIKEILDFKPKFRGTDIGSGLRYLSKVTKRRSVAFLISDFIIGEDEKKWQEYEHSLKVAKNRHDIIPIVVMDPMESFSLKDSFPYMGIVTFEDPETGDIIEVDTSNSSIIDSFKEWIVNERTRRENLFRKLKIDFINIKTDIYHGHFEQPLINFFKLRAKRIKRV